MRNEDTGFRGGSRWCCAVDMAGVSSSVDDVSAKIERPGILRLPPSLPKSQLESLLFSCQVIAKPLAW
jgi:hypothetical protein